MYDNTEYRSRKLFTYIVVVLLLMLVLAIITLYFCPNLMPTSTEVQLF